MREPAVMSWHTTPGAPASMDGGDAASASLRSAAELAERIRARAPEVVNAAAWRSDAFRAFQERLREWEVEVARIALDLAAAAADSEPGPPRWWSRP